MKKLYETPEVEIEKFTIANNVMTASGGGLDDFDEEVTIPDDDEF